jgi:tRNA (guanine37-N1)-methyltransferase
MKISVATLFPSLYDEFLNSSIIGKSIKKKLIDIEKINMLEIAGKDRIDTPIVGHGSGMIIKTEIIEKTINIIKQNNEKPFTIFFSPHGETLNQKKLHEIYNKTNENKKDILLIAGRYEGIDTRAEIEYADEIISIGDYVLMGGDLPSMIFIESFCRLIKGIIGDEESVKNDSFESALIDCPHFGNPDTWKNKKIPEILKSGDHKKIEDWRRKESIKRTAHSHFDWWRKNKTSQKDRSEFLNSIPKHYCAILHNDVMMPDGKTGESSVTSIDIHDIARSSTTYGIEHYFLITRLQAQQKIIDKFLNFWHENGELINENRSHALKNVSWLPELDDVIEKIKNENDGIDPVCIATSSRREIPHKNMISFYDQGKIWRLNRPILFIFGTAHGISPKIMEKIEFRLCPIEGMKEFNFLSVRSAAAIIFDRWFGINIV